MTKPIVIIGGRGKTGAYVADGLTALGIPVRMASRKTGFDWTKPETWAKALDGAAGAYITYYPDIMVKGAAEAIEALAYVAMEQGAKRLVLLSGRGEEAAQLAEQKLIGSGADYTVVRGSWFFQNFDEGQFQEMIVDGEVALPVDEVPEPFVDTRDIAEVAVAAFADDKHIGKIYEVSGGRMMTFSEAVAEINAIAGLNVRFTRMNAHEFFKMLEETDMPTEIAEVLEELFGVVLDGRNAYLSDGVQQVLGREPRDFADFVREAAASGVWRKAA